MPFHILSPHEREQFQGALHEKQYYEKLDFCKSVYKFFLTIIRKPVYSCFYWEDSHWIKNISSVIRQKGESQDECFKKKNHVKFSEKNRIFCTPLIRTLTRAYQGVKNVRFFGKSALLYFLKIHVLRFVLLPYYRRFVKWNGRFNRYDLCKAWKNFFLIGLFNPSEVNVLLSLDPSIF